MSTHWWVREGDVSNGPFDAATVRAGLSTGRFRASDFGCRVGTTQWFPLGNDPELAHSFTPSSPVQPFPLAAPTQFSSPTVSLTPKMNLYAIVSFVSSILGWLVLPFIGTFLAVFIGHLARGQIAASDGRETGDHLALAALIIAYTEIALACVALTFWAFLASIFAIGVY